MFTTLRTDKQSILSEYVNSRYVQQACSACRAKKLKCSGERVGCRRCATKGVECVYPDTSRGRSSKRRSNLSDKSKNKGAKSATAITRMNHSEQTNMNRPRSPLASPDPDYPETPSESTSNHSVQVNAESSASFNPAALDFDLNFMNSMGIFWTTTSPQPSGLGPENDPPGIFGTQLVLDRTDPSGARWIEIPAPSTESLPRPLTPQQETPSRQSNTVSPDSTMETGCDHLAVALSLLETTLISHPATTIHTVPRTLQSHKSTLPRLHPLLSCPACTLQTHYLTLLLTLTHHIATSYELIISVLGDQFNKLHPSEQERARLVAEAQRRRAEDGGLGDAEASLNLGKYAVDAEEEPCAYGGVVMLQLGILRRFLRKLKGVLADRGGEEHARVAEGVQGRVKDMIWIIGACGRDEGEERMDGNMD